MKKIIVASIFSLCLFAINASAQTNTENTVFSIADSASFTGKYKYEGLPFEYMEVYVKDGKLGYSGGQFIGFLDAAKDKKDTFYADGDAVFTFVRNKEDKVTELRIDYMGQSYYGTREIRKDQ